MPENNLASTYSGSMGVAYFKGRGQDNLMHLGYRLQARFYRPYLDRTMEVLDFGCGNGSMAAVLRDHVGSIEGLEVNEKPRKLAQNAFGLTVYDSLESIDDDKWYDAIISNHVLEHVPHPIALLRDLARRLKDNGLIVLMVPIEDYRSRRNQDWQSPDINHHLYTWAPLQFAHMLRESGFEPEEVVVVNSAWTHKAFFLGEGMLQDLFCKLFARLRKRRQLIAVARRRAL